jgi:hypothetical protein
MFSNVFVFASLCAVLLVNHGLSFKWDVDQLIPPDEYFTFSERYMFADRNGPFLMDEGESYIKVATSVTVL